MYWYRSCRFPDAIVVHGGAGFQVVQDDKGVLHQLSQGCFFIERLAYVLILLIASPNLSDQTATYPHRFV